MQQILAFDWLTPIRYTYFQFWVRITMESEKSKAKFESEEKTVVTVELRVSPHH